MKILKKYFILLSSILLLSGLFGCTNKNESAEEIMKKSFEAQKNITSMSCSLDMSLFLVSNNTPLDINMSGTFDIISKSRASKADLTINLSNLLKLDIISYSKQEGSEYNTYTGFKIGDQISWSKNSSDLSEREISPYLTNTDFDIADYRMVGKEKINGKDTYHIIGSISQEGFTNFFDSLNVFEQLNEDEKEAFDLILNLLDEIKLDIWIYTDNYLEAKIQFDMCDLLKSLVELSPETSADFSKAGFTITFDDYNNIYNIEIPQEALEAEEEPNYEGLLG